MIQAKTVDARRLKSMLHDGTELALLDVREAGQFGESHMLFAVPCPYSRIELAIGSLVPRRSAPVVLTDDGCSGIAERAALRLRSLGYTDLAVVEHAYCVPHVTAEELMRMKQVKPGRMPPF